MKFSEFNERFLHMDLYPFQEMMLDGEFDLTGKSLQFQPRNYMKSFFRNIEIGSAILRGESVLLVCATEESAKQTFEEIVKFFEMVNKND